MPLWLGSSPRLHHTSARLKLQTITLDRIAPYRDSPSEQTFELHEYPRHTKSARRGPRESNRARKRREKLEQLREADEMKFSHSLQFNAVPDWSNHYVAYSNLKKQYVAYISRSLYGSAEAYIEAER